MVGRTDRPGWLARGAVLLLAAAPDLSCAKEIKGTSVGLCHFGSTQSNPIRKQVNSACPLPFLNDAGSARRVVDEAAPWTHPIQCMVATNATARTERVYCLYSSSVFGDGHGASIITHPTVASDLIGADAFEDRPVYGGSRKRKFVPGPIVNKDGPAYTITATPGKGMGVVAKRKIRQGEIFMLDLPALIVGKKFLEDANPKIRRRLLRRGIAQLPEKTKEAVFKLAKSTGGEEIDDILGTNTCTVTMGEGETHLALYPEVSRINHACNPNAYYRFSSKMLTMEVVAYRDIQPGEEITISYTSLSLSRTLRRENLQENWHFNCKCSLCRASTDEVTLSEDRRKDIRKLRSKLLEHSTHGMYAEAVNDAEELIRITDEEGITWLLPEMHDILAAIHLDMRDFTNARRYGKMSLQGWEKFDSVDESQLESSRWFLKYIELVKKEIEREKAEKEQEEEEEIE